MQPRWQRHFEKSGTQMGNDIVVAHRCKLWARTARRATPAPIRRRKRSSTRPRPGTPTPLSPLFIGRVAPVLRRFPAVLSRFLASWPRRRERAKSGVKWAKIWGERGEKQRWPTGVGGAVQARDPAVVAGRRRRSDGRPTLPATPRPSRPHRQLPALARARSVLRSGTTQFCLKFREIWPHFGQLLLYFGHI